MEPVVQLVGTDVHRGIRNRRACLVDKVVDYPVLGEVFQAVGEVFPKQEFGEGELAQLDFWLHFPASKIAHGITEEPKNVIHIHSALILWQWIKSGNFLLKVLPKHLH